MRRSYHARRVELRQSEVIRSRVVVVRLALHRKKWERRFAVLRSTFPSRDLTVTLRVRDGGTRYPFTCTSHSWPSMKQWEFVA
jgi:hypothetical protein